MASNNYAIELAKEILESLKKEFKDKHLTGNLLRNTTIVETDKYVEIRISAPSYDFYEYFINSVVIPPKRGGLPTEYASFIDTQGSEYTMYWRDNNKNVHKQKMKPHNHIGYVNRTLTEGITNWMNNQNLDIKVER